MRLYEVEGRFSDDLSNLLKVMQGHANDDRASSEIPWSAINNMLAASGYPSVNKDTFDQILQQIDPSGDLVYDYDDQGVTLVTNTGTPEVDEPVDDTASGGLYLNPRARY